MPSKSSKHFFGIFLKVTDEKGPEPNPDPLVRGRVSDPHWFNADPDTDPDPAFFLIADPDSGSWSPDPDPGFMI